MTSVQYRPHNFSGLKYLVALTSSVLWGVYGIQGLCLNYTEMIYHKHGCYKIQPSRPSRILNDSTCLMENVGFIAKLDYLCETVKFSTEEIAGIWVEAEKEMKDITYHGPENTVSVFQEGMSLNLLINRDLPIQRFLLRNLKTNHSFFLFETENQMMQNFKNRKEWDSVEIIECQNFVFYLSKTYGAYRASVTLVQANRSTSEDEFLSRSGGVGGFFRYV